MEDIWEQLALGADISSRQLDALRDALPESQAKLMVTTLDDNERRAALKLGLTAPLLAEFYGSRWVADTVFFWIKDDPNSEEDTIKDKFANWLYGTHENPSRFQ